MAITLWQHIENITYNKPDWNSLSEEDKKTWSTYMINRFLSMDEDYLEVVNYVQMFYKLKPEYVYHIYKSWIPKRKFYTKYIKSSKKEIEESIKYISQYYKVSHKEAELYRQRLSEDEIDFIINSLGIQKNNKNEKIKKGRSGKIISRGRGKNK